jgi:tricorn protease
LPWCFRKQKIGPLVGKRTWGGLVGIGGNPELTDGGTVTSPRWALYGLEGQWEVENIGIAPDVDVDLDPAAARRGHDSQLEKSIENGCATSEGTSAAGIQAADIPIITRRIASVWLQ